MANRNGAKFGFTGLFPIRRGETQQLRSYLRSLDDTRTYPNGSPFSAVPLVHMTRLFIVDRLAYQGTPAKSDALRSDYLVWSCDFDGDSVSGLADAMIRYIPQELATIWSRCVEFPGVHSSPALSSYFERCQIDTNLLLADQPDASVPNILQALIYRRRLTQFIKLLQRKQRRPEVIQRGFARMLDKVRREAPAPGSL